MARLSYFRLYRNIILMYVLVLVLQGVGLFTPGWFLDQMGYSRGLFFRCGKDPNNTVYCFFDSQTAILHRPTLVLESLSFVLLCVVIVMLIIALSKCTNHKKDTAGNVMILIYVGIVSCLVFISAFCSLVGCAVFGANSPYAIRYSYYFAVMSGVGQLISMCVSYVYLVQLW